MKTVYITIFAAAIIFNATLSALDITILHTTDTHGELQATDEIKRIFQQSSSPNTIIIDCGDTVQGTFAMSLCRGAAAPETLNMLNYDLWIPGNHDLDFGIEPFNKYRSRFKGTILAGNWNIDGQTLQTWKMFEFQNIKVAVIGLSRADQQYRTMCVGYNLTASPEADVLPGAIKAAKDAGANAIILARHAGNYDHSGNLWQLARQFPEIDLVLGGHTHQCEPGISVAGCFYAQAGYKAANLGVITLVFDDDTGKLSQITGKLIPLPPPHKTVAHGRVITELAEDIQLPRRKTMNHPLAEIGAEAMLTATHADLAIHGNRAKNHRYSRIIDEYVLFEMFPFEDYVFTFELSKNELLELLSEQMENYKRQSYSFYVAGCQVEYDRQNHAINTDLPDKESYILAVSGFTFSGGNGAFPLMRKFMDKHNYTIHGRLRNCVRDYLTR